MLSASVACGGPEGLDGAEWQDEAQAEGSAGDELISYRDERRPPQGPDLLRIRSWLTYRRIPLGAARRPDGSTWSNLFVQQGELRERSYRCTAYPYFYCYQTWQTAGTSAIGATFRTIDSAYELRIDGFRASTDATLSGNVYVVSYRSTSSSYWYPLCTGGGRNEAVPFRGYFDRANDSWMADSTQLGFACHDSAVFKVIAWGYAPEVHPRHFMAALRAARADYCGTGDGYTYRGTEIDIYDLDGIRPRPAAAHPYRFEAAWMADEMDGEFPVNLGALCLSKLRWQSLSPDTPMPGTQACTSLPHGGEFEIQCDARTLGTGGEPTAEDYNWMRANGAVVYTRSTVFQ